jgi:uncharacterized membrane protein
MDAGRLLRHLFAPPALTRRRFPAASAGNIAEAIAAAEKRSSGEIRVAIETALPLRDLWAGKPARDRAAEVFAQLRVWDTELRNGVLIYVLMADRNVEIVADRGAAARISLTEWESVCRLIESHFQAGRFTEGAIAGVDEVGRLLEREFSVRPSGKPDRDELPNQPTLL